MTESNPTVVLKEIEKQNDTYPQFTFRYTCDYVEYTYKAKANETEQIKRFTNDQLAHELTYKQKTDVMIFSVLKCKTSRNTPLLVILARNKYHRVHIYCYNVVTEKMHSSIYLSQRLYKGLVEARISPEPIETTSNEVSYLLALTWEHGNTPFFFFLFKLNEDNLRIHFSPIVHVTTDNTELGKVSALDISRNVVKKDSPYPDVYISVGFDFGKALVYKVAIQDFDKECTVESPIDLTGLVDIDRHPITAVTCARTSSDPSELVVAFGQPRVEGRTISACYLKIVKVIDSKPPFVMERVLPYRLESIIQSVAFQPRETGLQLSILYEHDLSYGLNVWHIIKDVAKAQIYCETRKRHLFREFFTETQFNLQEQVEFYASAPERILQIMIEQELIRCTHNKKKRLHTVVKEDMKEKNKRIKCESHAPTEDHPTRENIHISQLNEPNHDPKSSSENNQSDQTSEPVQHAISTSETIKITMTHASTVESREAQHDEPTLSEDIEMDESTLIEDIEAYLAESPKLKERETEGIKIIETSIETTTAIHDHAELLSSVSDEAKETQVSDSVPENEMKEPIASIPVSDTNHNDEHQNISLDELDKLMEENNSAPVNDETTSAIAQAIDIKEEQETAVTLNEEEENDFIPSSSVVNEVNTPFTLSEDEAFDEIMGSDLSELNESELSEVSSHATVEATSEGAIKTEETQEEDTSPMDDFVLVETDEQKNKTEQVQKQQAFLQEKKAEQQDYVQEVETEQQNLDNIVETEYQELIEKTVNEEKSIEEVETVDLQRIIVKTDHSIEGGDNEQQSFIEPSETEKYDVIENVETEQQQTGEEANSEQQTISENVGSEEEQSIEEVETQLHSSDNEMDTEQQQRTEEAKTEQSETEYQQHQCIKEVKAGSPSIIEGADTLELADIVETEQELHKEMEIDQQEDVGDVAHEKQEDAKDIINKDHKQSEAMENEEAERQTFHQEEEKEQLEPQLMRDAQFVAEQDEDKSVGERLPVPETYFIDESSEKDSVQSEIIKDEDHKHNEAVESDEADIEMLLEDQLMEDTQFVVETDKDESVEERLPVPETYSMDESSEKESLQNDIVEKIMETDSEKYSEEMTEHSDSLESEGQFTEDSFDEEADYDEIPDYNDPDDPTDSNEYIEDGKDSIPDEQCILLESTDEEVAAEEDDDQQTTVSAEHLGSLQRSFVPAGSVTSEETTPKQSTAHIPTIDYIPVLGQDLLRFSTDVDPNVTTFDNVVQEELSPYVTADAPEENTATFNAIIPEEVPSSTVIPEVTSTLNTDVPEEITPSFVPDSVIPASNLNNEITFSAQLETMPPLMPIEPVFTPEELHKMEIENSKNEAINMLSNVLLSLSYHPANISGLMNGPPLSQEDLDTIGSFAWNEPNTYVKFILLEYCHKHNLGKEAMSLCKVLLKQKKNLLDEDCIKLKDLYKIYIVDWKFYYQREVNVFQPSGRQLLRQKEMERYQVTITEDDIKKHQEIYIKYYGFGQGI